MMKFSLFETPKQNHLKPSPTQQNSKQENIFLKGHNVHQMKTNMIGFVNSGKPCGSCPKK